jgi:hypothetical protein
MNGPRLIRTHSVWLASNIAATQATNPWPTTSGLAGSDLTDVV